MVDIKSSHWFWVRLVSISTFADAIAPLIKFKWITLLLSYFNGCYSVYLLTFGNHGNMPQNICDAGIHPHSGHYLQLRPML